MGQTEYLVIVEKYGPSSYGAYVPELPGIGVAGETEDEVRGLVAEAIRLYLDELERDENAAAESAVVNHYTMPYHSRVAADSSALDGLIRQSGGSAHRTARRCEP